MASVSLGKVTKCGRCTYVMNKKTEPVLEVHLIPTLHPLHMWQINMHECWIVDLEKTQIVRWCTPDSVVSKVLEEAVSDSLISTSFPQWKLQPF